MDEQKQYKDTSNYNEDWKPRPDPTTLTTQQLSREIGSLRELIEARLNAIDKATELFQTNLTRVPTETTQAVTTLEILMESRIAKRAAATDALGVLFTEKLEGLRTLVQKQFELRDIGVKETANLTTLALGAALSASKEAIEKQNQAFATSSDRAGTATTKQMETLSTAISALGGSIGDKVNDIKERVGSIESRSSGMSSLYGWIVAAVGVVFSGLTVVIAFIVYLSHSSVSAVAPIVIPK